MLAAYYRLTKPGIVYGNTITTVAAFLYASRWQVDPALLLATVAGNGLVIASACVLNNVFDRRIDARMRRTQTRALVTGAISAHSASMFAIALCILGFTLLLGDANGLAAVLSLVGFVVYVFFYTFSKRHTSLATLIGSVAGAAPVAVGYVAVAGQFDLVALILFLTLVCWQMPHFYAIAIRRLPEYRAAGIPVLPLVFGIEHTKKHIDLYIVAYLIAACSLTVLHLAGWTYFALVALSGIGWIVFAARGFYAADEDRWARQLFLCSLVVLLTFSIALSIGSIAP